MTVAGLAKFGSASALLACMHHFGPSVETAPRSDQRSRIRGLLGVLLALASASPVAGAGRDRPERRATRRRPRARGRAPDGDRPARTLPRHRPRRRTRLAPAGPVLPVRRPRLAPARASRRPRRPSLSRVRGDRPRPGGPPVGGFRRGPARRHRHGPCAGHGGGLGLGGGASVPAAARCAGDAGVYRRARRQPPDLVSLGWRPPDREASSRRSRSGTAASSALPSTSSRSAPISTPPIPCIASAWPRPWESTPGCPSSGPSPRSRPSARSA